MKKVHDPVDAVVDIVFVLDIVLSANTGFVSPANKIVMDPGAIRTRYMLSTMFVVDLVSAIPFILLVFAEPESGDHLGALTLLKCIRLLRVGRLMKRIDQLTAATYIRILKLLGGFMLIAHWGACAFFFLSRAARLVGVRERGRGGMEGEGREGEGREGGRPAAAAAAAAAVAPCL